MKLKVFVLASAFFISIFNTFSQKNEPVVMTIGGDKITKSEFVSIYLKNNNDPKFDQKSLDEYMDLYKKFRLKVAEAKALGYDTIPYLIRELEGYKEQLAQPYLIDTTKSNELVKEAYERMKYEIRASHILVRIDKNSSPSDTLKAYNKVLELKKRIENGEDFGEVAAGFGGSDDPSAANNKGDLGYFTAFQMVYPFETAAYKTPVGEISMPVRTNFGYHIVKVVDKRKARGTITTAHIMVINSESDSKRDDGSSLRKINDIYKQLQDGEDFAKLARLYSDDQGSKNRGGELPPFGSGTNQRMVTEFEDVAFSLKKDNDYSEPFKTDYGYHIVKRLSYKPLGDFKELKPTIQQKIKQGDRSKSSETVFVNRLKKENKFSDNSTKRLQWFYDNIDSTLFTQNWNAPKLKKNGWIFKYDKKKYNSQDFLNYISKQKHSNPQPIVKYINQTYTQWQNEIIINDEKSKLETKYPAYKALVQEYKDGILLYEIMKDEIWDKAIRDSIELQTFFENNSDKYKWQERIDATVFSSTQKKMVQKAAELNNIDTLSIDDILKQVNTNSELNLSGERRKYIPSDNEVFKNRKLNQGENDIFQSGEKYYFIILHEIIPPENKLLSETRGSVIQDYQEYLEKEWLNILEEKHNITINKDVLYQIGE